MAELTIFVANHPSVPVEDVIQALNRARYYGLNNWQWDGKANEFFCRFKSKKIKRWTIQPQEAAMLAIRIKQDTTLTPFSFPIPQEKDDELMAPEIPTMKMSPLFDPPEYYKNMDYVADVLNQNKHRNQTDWKWDSGDQAFVIRGQRYVHSISGVDAQYIAGFYQTRDKNMGNALKMEPAPECLATVPRFNKAIELTIEAHQHLSKLTDEFNGIPEPTIKACLRIVCSMFGKLRDDMRSLERQWREGK